MASDKGNEGGVYVELDLTEFAAQAGVRSKSEAYALGIEGVLKQLAVAGVILEGRCENDKDKADNMPLHLALSQAAYTVARLAVERQDYVADDAKLEPDVIERLQEWQGEMKQQCLELGWAMGIIEGKVLGAMQ